MKNWTIGRRVTGGFGAIILISAGICVFSVLRLGVIADNAGRVGTVTVPSLHYLGDLAVRSSEDHGDIVELVHATSAEGSADLRASMVAFPKAQEIGFASLEPTIVDDQCRAKFAVLKSARDEYLAARTRLLEQKTQSAATLNDGFKTEFQPKYKAYAAAFDDLINDNYGNGVAQAKEINTAVFITRVVVLVGSVISLLVSVWIAWSVTLSLKQTLETLASALLRMNTSSNEMAATLKEQQASANEMASTTVEIGATAKEISATSKELGKTMGEVAKVAEQTAQLAGGGQSGLTRMEATMRQILEAASTISAKLAILNEKTTNINAVVTTINKVADQTNLLSLNAAIEAEKAGEYGQGFAVVATEIRRLADQTAVATYDIELMVKEMQSAVAAGVMGMDKFNEEVRRGGEEARQVTAQLGEIIQQVQAQTPRFEAVNEGMQAQATGASQISEALGQLGETAQQSAQALRQNTEALEQLSLAARGLQEAQALFKDSSRAVSRVSS